MLETKKYTCMPGVNLTIPYTAVLARYALHNKTEQRKEYDVEWERQVDE